MYYILLSISLKQDGHMDGAVSPGIHFQALEEKNDHEKSARIHQGKVMLDQRDKLQQTEQPDG